MRQNRYSNKSVTVRSVIEPLHKQKKRTFTRGFKQAVPKKSLAISNDHLYLIKHVNEGQIKKIEMKI